jgi:hypothetical protein
MPEGVVRRGEKALRAEGGALVVELARMIAAVSMEMGASAGQGERWLLHASKLTPIAQKSENGFHIFTGITKAGDFILAAKAAALR